MTATPASTAAITCTNLRFAWPDGTEVLDGLDLAIGPGRTGLVGRNGCGKSTLLRLIAGELTPSAGHVHAPGSIARLPQGLTLEVDRTIADVLGIAGVRAALRALERGEGTTADLDAIGGAWDVEELARAALARLGPELATGSDASADVLDRTIGTLSGGEAVAVSLVAVQLAHPAIALLDEPTNDLDRTARGRLYDAVAGWRGVLVVVSHDRELLERMDAIVELRDGHARTYGGGWSAYEAQVAAEQEAARRKVRAAETDLRVQQRQLAAAHAKLDRRQRYGRKMTAQKREPKIIMNARKREAQVSAGAHRIMHEAKASEARERLIEAEDGVRDDARIRIDLPDTALPSGREVLDVDGGPRTLGIRGPERVGLVGHNGSGKTTLLRAIGGHAAHPGLSVRVHLDRVATLPQRRAVLDDTATVAQNLTAVAPSASRNRIQADLARFLIRAERVDLPAATLSGGERFRVTLARLLVAEPPPQLLLLDEPTNDLDLDSVAQLQDALAAYRGALIVASHDLPFLQAIGLDRWWQADARQGLVEVPTPCLDGP